MSATPGDHAPDPTTGFTVYRLDLTEEIDGATAQVTDEALHMIIDAGIDLTTPAGRRLAAEALALVTRSAVNATLEAGENAARIPFLIVRDRQRTLHRVTAALRCEPAS